MGQRIDAWRASDGTIFFAEQDMLDHEASLQKGRVVIQWAAQYPGMNKVLKEKLRRVFKEKDMMDALQNYFAYIA